MDAHLRTQRIAAIYFPTTDLAKGVAVAAALVVGGLLSSPGHTVVTVGTVAAFVLYLQNVFDPIQQLSQLFNTFQSSAAALRKLFEVLDTKAGVDERPGAVDLPATGVLEVAGVSFRYSPAAPLVLDDVSISLQPGQRLALVGPTGAGKSTLAKVMARFYDPVAGSVTFGGIDVRDAGLASLPPADRGRAQEGFLFAGTVRDNIVLGREEINRRPDTWRAGRSRHRRPGARPPRRPRHRGASAGLQPVGRATPAGLAGAVCAGRPGRARAGRGHLEPRPGHRADRRAGRSSA